MMSLVRQIIEIPLFLKAKYKKRQFKKYAICGKNLKIYATANCVADHPGNIRIDDDCELLCTLVALGEGRISIGRNTTIRFDSKIGAIRSVTIGANVIISNNVHIYDNNNHPVDPQKRLAMSQSHSFSGPLWSWTESASAPVTIEDNVWIGERATILKGVTIGEGSVIACDSVVTKSMPAYSVVAGNPAKVVKYLR